MTLSSRNVYAAILAATCTLSITACKGLKDAMTAHVNTVARAGTQELTVDRLANLLNEAKVEPRKDVANAIANAWLDYQLLGQAAATGDTVVTPKEIDDVMWAAIGSFKVKKYLQLVSKDWGSKNPNDTAEARRMYESGDVLAASHILLLTRGQSDDAKAVTRKKAEALRTQATSANFAQLAKANSQDQQSAVQGGMLGLFPRGRMVPQFEQALLQTKPGEISPVIETEFGYHIIRRPTFDEVKAGMLQAVQARAMQASESTFVSNLQKNNKLEMRTDAAATTRAVLANPEDHLNDGSTIATMSWGKFTAGRLAQWLQTAPPLQVQQMRQQLQNAPDSIAAGFTKQFINNDLLIHSADSAKIGPTPDEMRQLHEGFVQSRDASWTELGVDPKSLADSGKTAADRARIAGKRIEAYMDKLVTGQVQFAQVAEPVARVLRNKAGASISSAGIDRGLERAQKVRGAADSTRRASQPPSLVPMPGSAGQGAVSNSQPQTAPAPAPQTAPQPSAPPTSHP